MSNFNAFATASAMIAGEIKEAPDNCELYRCIARVDPATGEANALLVFVTGPAAQRAKLLMDELHQSLPGATTTKVVVVKNPEEEEPVIEPGTGLIQ